MLAIVSPHGPRWHGWCAPNSAPCAKPTLDCSSLGFGNSSIILREILPNALAPLVVTTSILIAQAILVEAGLAFLGMSDPNQASWGAMLGSGREQIASGWYSPPCRGWQSSSWCWPSIFWATVLTTPSTSPATVYPMSLLDVRGLRVSYDNADAVKDLSFTLQAGETLALVGESGCGKSTTALALMGLLPDNTRLAGQVLFEGRDLLSMAPRQMRQLQGNALGMIFQDPLSSPQTRC